MTWFRVGGAGIPATLKNAMNAVFNKKFGTSGQNYPPKQWPDDVNLLGPLPEGTATGSIANFSDGADDVPTKNVIATIAPNFDGVSSVDVVNCGKNLYDVDGAVYDGEFYDASGNVVRYADCAVSWIKVNPSTQYSFSCTKETSQTVNVRIAWCKSDKSFISRQGLFSDNQFPMTLTTPSNCEWIQLSVNQYGAATIAQNNWSIQVEKSSAATTFEPYSGTTHTAALGRTIYGGMVDVVQGTAEPTNILLPSNADMAEMTINGIKRSYSLNNQEFTFNGTNTKTDAAWLIYSIYASDFVLDGLEPGLTYRFSHNLPDYMYAQITYNKSGGGISAMVYLRGNLGRNASVSFTLPNDFSSLRQFQIGVSSDATNIDITAHFQIELGSSTSAYSPYFEPFTFTGQEINSLYGVNNFWNDAGGDTTVVYRRDIDLALQAVSSSRGLMMASRPVTQLVGEESDPDQVNELVENDETEQEGESDAR